MDDFPNAAELAELQKHVIQFRKMLHTLAVSRAFALRRLNRSEEADQALATGLKLCKKPLPWLTTIGLIP